MDASQFQNYLTEFDLELLNETATANQATTSTQCPVARKKSIARMKDRLKNVSQLVIKAKNKSEVLVEVQKQLQETKQELQETKKMLYEKNEEHKVTCNERNTYFNQTLEYSNELKSAKEQLKIYEQKDFDTKMKDKVIQGYSAQMQGLQAEMENLMKDKKQNDKEFSIALGRASKGKDILEKKLVRVLNNYVYPTIKKRDKWLQSLVKKYVMHRECENQDLLETISDETIDDDILMSPLTSEHKKDETQKIPKSSVEAVSVDRSKLIEVVLDDVKAPASSSMLNRTISLEFEHTGSVDTGRGSSLAFSDGEKSYHSPDYYMNDSPLCTVPNLCNRCNVPKSDVSTSPIPQEKSDFITLKKDASVSPMPSKKLDVATNTADISDAITTLEDQINISSEVCHSNIKQTIPISTDIDRMNILANATKYEEIASHNISIDRKTSSTPPVKLIDKTMDTDEVENNFNRIASLVNVLTTVPVVEYDDVTNNDISISSIESPKTPVKLRDSGTSNSDAVENNFNRIISSVEELTSIPAADYDEIATNYPSVSTKESPTTPVKVRDKITIKTDEGKNTYDRIVSSIEKISTISAADYDEVAVNDLSVSSIESPTTPVKLRNIITNKTDEVENNFNRIASMVNVLTSIPVLEYDDATNDDISISSIRSPTTPEKLEDNMTSNIDAVKNNFNKIASSVEDLTAISEADYGEVITNNLRFFNKESPTSPLKLKNNITSNTTDEVENKFNRIASMVNVLTTIPVVEYDEVTNDDTSISSIQTSTTPVKLRDNITSNIDAIKNNLKIASSVEDLTAIPATEYEEDATNMSIYSKESHTTPVMFCNISPNVELNFCRNTLQEKECLELNNSNNVTHDLATEIEIQTIINKMQLCPRLITPIPRTPPPDTMRLLTSNDSNTVIDPKPHPVSETIDELLNRVGKKILEALIPLERLPEYVDQIIPKLFSSVGWNQEVLRNLLHLSSSSNNRHISDHNAQKSFSNNDKNIDSNYNAQGNVVDLNTASTINTTEIRKNIDHDNESSTSNTEADLQNLGPIEKDHIKSRERNNNEKVLMGETHKEPSNTIEKKCIITIPKIKVTESKSIASLTNKSNYDKSSNINDISNENTQQSFSNNDIDIETSNSLEASVANLTTSSTLITTDISSNIVFYDTEDSDDGNTPQDLESDDFEHIHLKESNDYGKLEMCKKQPSNIELPKRIRNMRKLTKLEKLRLKMAPKGKIRKQCKQPVKKLRFKPKPIITVPKLKKTVTESDSAASLNDKSVYENAVKVIAAAKLKKIIEREPRVIVEDCVIKMQNNPDKSVENSNVKEMKLHSAVCSNLLFEFKNLTEAPANLKDAPEQAKQALTDKSEPTACKRLCISNSPETCDLPIETKRVKRKKTSIREHQKSGEIISDEPESTRNSELMHSFDLDESMVSIETKKGKRKRLSSDCQSNHENSNNNIKFTDTNNHIRTSHHTDDNCSQKRRSISTRQSSDSKIGNTVDLEDIISKTVAKKRRTNSRRESEGKLNNNQFELLFSDQNQSKAPNCESSEDYSNCKNNAQLINSTSKHSVAKNLDIIYKPSSPRKNQTIHKDLCDHRGSTSQRILRSSYVKDIVETAPDLVVENSKYNHEAIHSNPTDQNHSEKCENIASLTSLKRKPRTARATFFESKKIESKGSSVSESVSQKNHDRSVSYADISLFQNGDDCNREQNKETDEPVNVYKNSMLCRMIEKYGVKKIQYIAKKIPDSKVNEICEKLDTSISNIIELPHDQCQGAMKRLVEDIRNWDVKHFLVGLIKYLKDPQRKIELFNKVACPPAPPMTKREQVLLYVIDKLQNSYEYRGIVKKILMNIEYVLFGLNKTPVYMEVIETMSHFYAILCRNYQKISKLRLFIVDAMYCLQFKSIVLVKQCLEVWMFILPLGHMGLAKSPLVSCLVYLLHFYKCEDKLDRIQDIRIILRRKYNYDLADWNESKILDEFRTAIKEVRDIPLEKKMLRLALIILAKRNGAPWCHNNIVKKMLQPLIADKSTSEAAKRFCVSVLGALLKPYPNNMKVHCEMITDYLVNMLEEKHSPEMQEAIITSLLCLNKHNNRVIKFLLKWNAKHIVSPEFESVFKNFVRSKTVRTWKIALSQI